MDLSFKYEDEAPKCPTCGESSYKCLDFDQDDSSGVLISRYWRMKCLKCQDVFSYQKIYRLKKVMCHSLTDKENEGD